MVQTVERGIDSRKFALPGSAEFFQYLVVVALYRAIIVIRIARSFQVLLDRI